MDVQVTLADHSIFMKYDVLVKKSMNDLNIKHHIR